MAKTTKRAKPRRKTKQTVRDRAQVLLEAFAKPVDYQLLLSWDDDVEVLCLLYGYASKIMDACVEELHQRHFQPGHDGKPIKLASPYGNVIVFPRRSA